MAQSFNAVNAVYDELKFGSIKAPSTKMDQEY